MEYYDLSLKCVRDVKICRMTERVKATNRSVAVVMIIAVTVIAVTIWIFLSVINGPIYVKYRTNGPVNIRASNFEPLNNSGSTVRGAWYDSSQEYMIIDLNGTYYQYCGLPVSTWDWLKGVDPDAYYQTDIKGNFDCRVNPVQEY